MRTTIILLLVMACFHHCTAQYIPREFMLGIRGGGSAGITFKKFMGNNFAFEMIMAKDFPRRQSGLFVSGLFEKHAPLLGNKFSALIGAGPAYHFNRESMGVSGIIGFDWRILNAPVNLQVDWSPAYYFSGSDPFTPVNGALSVRYIINRKKIYEQKRE